MGFSISSALGFAGNPLAALPGVGQYLAQEETNRTNENIARNANEMSLSSAREQMAFQERLSNTSYQRAMQDMKAAGLNPMLAFAQGGASTPAGASMTAQTHPYESAAGKAIEGISSAAQTAMSMKLSGAQAANQEASAIAAGSQAQLNEKSAQAQVATAAAQEELAKQRFLENKQLEADLPRAQAESKFEIEKYNQRSSKYEVWSDYLGRALGNASSARDLAPTSGARQLRQLKRN